MSKTVFVVKAMTENLEKDCDSFFAQNSTNKVATAGYNFVEYGFTYAPHTNAGNLGTFWHEKDQDFADDTFIVGYGFEVTADDVGDDWHGLADIREGDRVWIVQTPVTAHELGIAHIPEPNVPSV